MNDATTGIGASTKLLTLSDDVTTISRETTYFRVGCPCEAALESLNIGLLMKEQIFRIEK